MKPSLLVVLAVPFVLLTGRIQAQCGCAAGPCEAETLQSVAARDPLITEFDVEYAIARERRATGMAIDFGPRRPTLAGTMAVTLFLGVFLMPVVWVGRRLLACGEPPLELGLSTSATGPDEGVEQENRPRAQTFFDRIRTRIETVRWREMIRPRHWDGAESHVAFVRLSGPLNQKRYE